MAHFTTSLAIVALFVSCIPAATIKAYNADPNSVSVSGISAGGFMAAQLGVAHSDVFKTGFGVFAGGPFDCARNQYYFSCMNNNQPAITMPTSNMRTWSGNQIDNLSNLQSRKIFMEVGASDAVVGPKPMNQLRTQLANFGSAANTAFITRTGQAHVFPTDFDSTGNNACSSSTSPYISNCGYDGAGEVLKWMYGSLAARNNGTPTGTVVSFDQTGSYGALGMASTGYLYVPQACQTGTTVCKLHVALHGCLQSTTQIQMRFIDNTGYKKWADTNNIIILYPQAVPDNQIRQTWMGVLSNPNACFDWVGWYGNNADQKGGIQMAAIVNQVKQVISGFTAS